METRHAVRARTIYGATPTKPVKKPVPPPRKSLYSQGRGSGSIENAVASCFDRIDAGLRDDPERLQQSRATRARMIRVFEERRATPEHTHTICSTFYDHQKIKRSAESLAKRWPMEWDVIRRTAGSTEEAEKILANAVKFYEAIKQADPVFAQTAKENGSAETAAMILAAANYAELPTPTKE
jgi:hypothetical protein